jgi:membrane protein
VRRTLVGLRMAAAGWRGTRDTVVGAVRTGLATGITDIAATLAYYGFLAVPAILLVVVGAFGVTGGRSSTQDVVNLLDDGVVPDPAVQLIRDTLTRVTASTGQSAGLALVGLVLALWTVSGAMQALIRGLNRIHGCPETRSFARLRATALGLFGWTLFALVVSITLLVFGTPLSEAFGDWIGAPAVISWLWWALRWPIVGGALFVAIAGILRMAPAEQSAPVKGQAIGAGVAVIVWLVASAGFGIYVSRFGSYGAAWGSLSAVIVMLTWLWLTALAVLMGAQLEVEVGRRAS